MQNEAQCKGSFVLGSACGGCPRCRDEWKSLRQAGWHLVQPPQIAGRSLAEWQEFARRDDCLDQMVPSDLRQLIGKIKF